MKRSILLSGLILFFAEVSFSGNPYRVGDYAIDFTLKNVNGELTTLSSLPDTKGYILIFTSNSCPLSKKYEQRIKDLNYEFAGKGYPVVAISSNDMDASPEDSFQQMQKTAKERGFQFQYLFDVNQEVAREFGATGTPQVFVISKQNSYLKVEYVGAIDNNADDESGADKTYVKDTVNALLKGDQVQVTLTRVEGCGIKWSPVTSSR